MNINTNLSEIYNFNISPNVSILVTPLGESTVDTQTLKADLNSVCAALILADQNFMDSIYTVLQHTTIKHFRVALVKSTDNKILSLISGQLIIKCQPNEFCVTYSNDVPYKISSNTYIQWGHFVLDSLREVGEVIQHDREIILKEKAIDYSLGV